MSIYKFDPETKEMVCISDRNGRLPSSVYWRDGHDHSGMRSEHCGVTFRSKGHKRRWLAHNNVREAG